MAVLLGPFSLPDIAYSLQSFLFLGGVSSWEHSGSPKLGPMALLSFFFFGKPQKESKRMLYQVFEPNFAALYSWDVREIVVLLRI